MSIKIGVGVHPFNICEKEKRNIYEIEIFI